jgi:hypothetical protein
MAASLLGDAAKVIRMRTRPPKPESFRHGAASYVEAFERLLRNEPTRHTSIFGIRLVAADDPILGLPTDQQLRKLGYGEGYKPYDWQPSGDGYGVPTSENSGSTTLWKDRIGRLRTLIILKEPDLPDGYPNRDEEVAVYNIAVLLHEVGHVHDAENRITVRKGKPGKFKDSELEAHRYACRRMVEENFLYPLGKYLGSVVTYNLTNEVQPIREAAEAFLKSPEYTRYHKCALF